MIPALESRVQISSAVMPAVESIKLARSDSTKNQNDHEEEHAYQNQIGNGGDENDRKLWISLEQSRLRGVILFEFRIGLHVH